MIERIEALIAAATPGPWRTARMLPLAVVSEPTDSIVATIAEWSSEVETADAAFVAHARQLLPLMLEVVKASDELRCNCFAASPLLQFVDKTIEDLYAYCAELPEEEK